MESVTPAFLCVLIFGTFTTRSAFRMVRETRYSLRPALWWPIVTSSS